MERLDLYTAAGQRTGRTLPRVLVKSTLRVYRPSPAVTELKEFPGRGHSVTSAGGRVSDPAT